MYMLTEFLLFHVIGESEILLVVEVIQLQVIMSWYILNHRQKMIVINIFL